MHYCVSCFFYVIFMTTAKAKTWEKDFANHSSNWKQTNTCIFGLLGSTYTQQTFSNFSCFGDRNATIVSLVSIFLHRIQNLSVTFLNFVNISSLCIMHSIVKLGLHFCRSCHICTYTHMHTWKFRYKYTHTCRHTHRHIHVHIISLLFRNT